MSLTISCVTHGRSALFFICIVGMCKVDNRLTSALNMSQRWFGSLCLCAMNVLVMMAKSFLKSDQLAFLYDLTCLRFCLMRPRLTLISWNTISWSDVPNPGNVLVSWTWLCLLVRNKSSMLLFRVGILNICSSVIYHVFSESVIHFFKSTCVWWWLIRPVHVWEIKISKNPYVTVCGIFSTDDHNSFSECSSCSCGL